MNPSQKTIFGLRQSVLSFMPDEAEEDSEKRRQLWKKCSKWTLS